MAKPATDVADEKITDYINAMILPFKFVGYWHWFPNPTKEYHRIINSVYVAFVLFILLNLQMSLFVHVYTRADDNMMDSIMNLADGLPVTVSVLVVAYFSAKRKELNKLVTFMNTNFKYYSAKGLTNMTMRQSYNKAKSFALFYTSCTLFSVAMYVSLPIIVHLWTKQPLAPWVYRGVSGTPSFVLVFVRQVVAHIMVALAVGQLGVFFTVNAILLCGQYDVLCCSLRNARYTALLRRGVAHEALARAHGDIVDDEMFAYIYSKALMRESEFHFNEKVTDHFAGKRMEFDIYNPSFDEATCQALRDCARAGQVTADYRRQFERFISPLLALRVINSTLYICTLLYAASMKFDMLTGEYLVAVAFDIFLYCYFADQIIVQADRVTTAAYTGAWPATGARPRRLLVNLMLEHTKPITMRAGRFLPMDLNTFVMIMKTSFSYYTLLRSVNDKNSK